MTQRKWSDTMVNICVEVPQELARGIETMARLKGISRENLLRFWIEDGLERDELRLERLLLFADISEDLDEASCKLISSLRSKYFDEAADGERGLDSYLIKSPKRHHQYTTYSDSPQVKAVK